MASIHDVIGICCACVVVGAIDIKSAFFSHMKIGGMTSQFTRHSISILDESS